MLLLVGAGLLLRSLGQVEQLTTGFNPRGVMSGVLSLPPTVYKTDEQQTAFYVAAEEQLANMPGVVSAGFVDILPFTNTPGSSSFSIKGRVFAANDPGPHGKVHAVSPGYFETLGIPLVRGRVFTSQDRMKTELVAVVDETLAHQYWPNEDPIGQQINFGGTSPWMRIVGLVKHAKSSSLESDTNEGIYYLCINKQPVPSAGLAVRTRSNHPENLSRAIQAAIQRVDSHQPVYDLKTMEERVDDSLIGRRFLVVLLSIFAGLALLLAAVGLYGVISYSVRLRTRELGIRVALGAEKRDVLQLILRQGMRLAAAGLIFGFIAIFIAGRALSSLLYNVSLFNLPTLLLTTLLLIATVFLASYLPAHGATKVEPLIALRDE